MNRKVFAVALLALGLQANACFDVAPAAVDPWFGITKIHVADFTVPRPFERLLAQEAQDAQEVHLPPADMDVLMERAGHGHQVDTGVSDILDANIFVDLSPVTAEETPVKLPPDQALE